MTASFRYTDPVPVTTSLVAKLADFEQDLPEIEQRILCGMLYSLLQPVDRLALRLGDSVFSQSELALIKTIEDESRRSG